MASEIFKIKIEVDISNERITLIGYYRPPTHDNLNIFLNDLQTELSTHRKVLIGGDLNIDLNHTSAAADSYCDIISSFGAYVLNDNVTRPVSGTLIDHLVAKDVPKIDIICTVHTALSDHSFLIAFYNDNFNVQHGKQSVSKSHTNYEAMRRDFKLDNRFFNINNPNELTHMLQSAITDALDSSTLRKNFTFKRNFVISPWLNYNISEQLKKIENISHKIRLLRNCNRPTSTLEAKYIRLRQKTNRNMLLTCKSFYQRLFTNCNSKLMWRNVNSIIGRAPPKQNISLAVDDVVYNDSRAVANIFSKRFALMNNSKEIYDPHFILNPMNSHTMFLMPTQPDEIESIINSIATKRAIGPDGIAISVIKELKTIIIHPLCHLINSIFETAVYPCSFKKVLITPIFKGGDKNDASCYRPIAVGNALSKVVEHVLVSRINEFIEKHNYIDNFQFGFKKNCGTDIALSQLMNDVLLNIDAGKIVAILFLDISSAFNSLPHENFHNKMNCYGIRGHSGDLIRDYMSGRCEAIRIGNIRSDYKTTSSGINQGSITGPHFFNIHLDDLKNVKTISKIIRFADDTCIYLPFEKKDFDSALSIFIHDISEVIRYLNLNGLRINESKSHVMFMRSSSSSFAPPSIVNAAGFSFECVASQKYLGCVLDDKVNMKLHTEKVIKSITPTVGIISKLCYYLPQHILKQIYFSHFHSHITYLIAVYGHCGSGQIERLQVIQNRALKFIYRLDNRHPTIDIYTKIAPNILPILGLLYFSTVVLVHKIVLNQVEVDIIAQRQNNSTRQRGRIVCHKFNTNYGKKSISYFGFMLYNRLPPKIADIKNIHKFKMAVRKLLRNKINQILNCTNSLDLLCI
jgi:hypothetical protein